MASEAQTDTEPKAEEVKPEEAAAAKESTEVSTDTLKDSEVPVRSQDSEAIAVQEAPSATTTSGSAIAAAVDVTSSSPIRPGEVGATPANGAVLGHGPQPGTFSTALTLPVKNALDLRHERLSGVVVKPPHITGWGTIKSHMFEGEIFFRTDRIMPEFQAHPLHENEGVEFDITPDETGRPQAVTVKPIIGRKPQDVIGQRHRGYVRRFAERWGFLNSAAFDGDLFIHRDNLLPSPEEVIAEGQPMLRTGQAVEFDVALDDRGRTVAKQITTRALLRPNDWIGHRMRGVIRSFQGAWGFINCDRFAGDLFVHRESLIAQCQSATITIGTVVEFDIERDNHRRGTKNRLVARNVAVLGASDQVPPPAPAPYPQPLAMPPLPGQDPAADAAAAAAGYPPPLPPYGAVPQPPPPMFYPPQGAPPPVDPHLAAYGFPPPYPYHQPPYPYPSPYLPPPYPLPYPPPPVYGQPPPYPYGIPPPVYGHPPPNPYLQPPYYHQPPYPQPLPPPVAGVYPPQVAVPTPVTQDHAAATATQAEATTATAGTVPAGSAPVPVTTDGQSRGLLHITMHDWEPDQPGQLCVTKGTLVNISYRAAHGWVYAGTVTPGNESGEPASEGWIPQAVVKRVSLCRVSVDWPAEGQSTMGVTKGEIIAVSKEAERGWVYGERLGPKIPDKASDGWLPKKVLEYLQP